ncbi:MAG: ABC transporter permease [Thermomicrobiales bacterium]
MARYIQRRLVITIPILIAITAIIFGLLQLTPGDPLDAYLGPDVNLSQAQRDIKRHELGLDRPAPIRYVYWLREVAKGNLGNRIKTGEPVGTVIKQRIIPTLSLMGSGLAIGILLGVVLGVISAVKQYSFLDFILTVLAFLGASTPAFFAGLLGLYVFALRLGWFPAGGLATPGVPYSFWDHLHHIILPALMLSLFQVSSIMRYTRSAMLGVLTQDYIRTAQAKGLSRRVTVASHALRNAMIPIITVIGATIPALVGGAVFLESIFSWPGMGTLYLDAIAGRDYPLIMGITFIIATVILVANLLTDLAYAFIDPRIRYG